MDEVGREGSVCLGRRQKNHNGGSDDGGSGNGWQVGKGTYDTRRNQRFKVVEDSDRWEDLDGSWKRCVGKEACASVADRRTTTVVAMMVGAEKDGK